MHQYRRACADLRHLPWCPRSESTRLMPYWYFVTGGELASGASIRLWTPLGGVAPDGASVRPREPLAGAAVGAPEAVMPSCSRLTASGASVRVWTLLGGVAPDGASVLLRELLTGESVGALEAAMPRCTRLDASAARAPCPEVHAQLLDCTAGSQSLGMRSCRTPSEGHEGCTREGTEPASGREQRTDRRQDSKNSGTYRQSGNKRTDQVSRRH